MVAFWNEGPFTLTSGEALVADRLVKMSTTTVIYADAGDEPMGITQEAVDNGKPVAIWPINKGGIAKVTASKAITAGSTLYPANDGKVSDAAGGGRKIGVNLTAASADGGKIPAVINIFSGDLLLQNTSVIHWREEFLTGCTEDGHKFSETADKADWLLTVIDGGSDEGEVCNVTDDAPGGWLTLTTNDAAADACQLQLNGEAFKLAVGKPLFFKAKIILGDISETDFFIGLAVTDTTILAGVTDRVGFELNHDGNLDFLTEQNSTENSADTTVNVADGTIATESTKAVTVGFYWDGVDTLTPYVDDVAYAAMTDNGSTILVPDDETLTPTIAMLVPGAAAESAYIDVIDIVYVR